MKRESGKLTVSDLASRMGKSKVVGDQNLSNEERATLIQNFHPNLNDEVDFEFYLRVSIIVSLKNLQIFVFLVMKIAIWFDLQIYLNLQAHVNAIIGSGVKNSSAFLKAATTTLLHTISDSEKSSYVAHINNYLSGDEFLNKCLPINPSSNDLFEVAKDGVLLW